MQSNQSSDLKTLLMDLHDKKSEIISGGMYHDPDGWIKARECKIDPAPHNPGCKEHPRLTT